MSKTLAIRLVARLLAAWTLLALQPLHAADEPWPAARPIRMVVPSGAGSGTDIFARSFGARLAQALQQTIIYDNKAGANGIIGNDAGAKAAPDGYTLLFSNASAMALNPVIQPRLPYQTLKDLVPVVQIGSGGVLLVVSADFPARNLEGFVRHVKAHPDKLAYGTWGVGSTGHLSMEALKAKAGLSMNHVPYKTMGQIFTDMQGGMLSIAFVDAVSSLPLIKAGKIIPIGITGTRRTPRLPEVPTTQEQGYRLGADGWYGIFAPAGTAPAIVQRINAETNRLLADPQLKPAFEALNMAEPPIKTSAEFEKTLREDIETWREIARNGRLVFDAP